MIVAIWYALHFNGPSRVKVKVRVGLGYVRDWSSIRIRVRVRPIINVKRGKTYLWLTATPTYPIGKLSNKYVLHHADYLV
jgi:hypothetical protein